MANAVQYGLYSGYYLSSPSEAKSPQVPNDDLDAERVIRQGSRWKVLRQQSLPHFRRSTRSKTCVAVAACCLIAMSSLAQQDNLGYPSITRLSGTGQDNPTYVTIPAPSSSDSAIYFTLNIVSLGNYSVVPSFFLSNTSRVTEPSASNITGQILHDSSSGNADPLQGNLYANTQGRNSPGVWQIKTYQGFGNWTGWARDSASLTIDWLNQTGEVELGLSTLGPIHSVAALQPLLGDTIAEESLVMSPVLARVNLSQPTYPNYTLASAFDESVPAPAGLPSMRIILVPTSESPATLGLGHSLASALTAENNTGTLANATTTNTTFLRHTEGWRWAYLTGGLEPLTNYTAWTVENDDETGTRGTVSGPILLSTKAAAFPCPLAYNIPICPNIAYAAALDPLEGSTSISAIDSLLQDTLSSSLQAFATSLLTTACGRDMYSPVSTCEDCLYEYRDWLCRTIIPQCGPMSDTLTGNAAISPKIIARTPQSPRSNWSSVPSFDYNELLPCMATCRRVQRTCPDFLQIRCPVRGQTAQYSYAFYGNDNNPGHHEGDDDGGIDAWGNRWCNGGPDPRPSTDTWLGEMAV